MPVRLGIPRYQRLRSPTRDPQPALRHRVLLAWCRRSAGIFAARANPIRQFEGGMREWFQRNF